MAPSVLATVVAAVSAASSGCNCYHVCADKAENVDSDGDGTFDAH